MNSLLFTNTNQSIHKCVFRVQILNDNNITNGKFIHFEKWRRNQEHNKTKSISRKKAIWKKSVVSSDVWCVVEEDKWVVCTPNV